MSAPDENPVIASLLGEAAQLAAAANEKLAEALAIAEQTRRDAAFNADWRFFRDNPDRSYRVRLATTQDEVADMMACARAINRAAWAPWTGDYRRIEGVADMKPHLSAAAYLVGALSASPALAGKPDREQTTWAGECIIFKTPTAGSVPCDMTSPKFTLTDGKSYRFNYVNAEGHDRGIYFVNDPDYYDTTPVVPGIFRVTHVQDDRRPMHAGVDARGSCDTRGGFIRCEATADLGEYVIIYRIVEESEHLICPPPADVPHEVGDVCATTYSPAEARKVRWDKWEQTVWSATCETFQTPWAGIVPCDKAEPEFTITSTHNDGSVSFGFEYGLNEADWGGGSFSRLGRRSSQVFIPSKRFKMKYVTQAKRRALALCAVEKFAASLATQASKS